MRNIEVFPERKTNFKNPDKIILDERDESIWINSVFGVNKEGKLPARFLSGFISTFGLAEMIQERTKGRTNPQVRIFIPSNIGSFVNEINPDFMKQQVDQGTKLLEKIVKNHFPTVNVFIDEDKPITEEALDILGNVINLFADHADNNLISSIQESGRRHGGSTGSENALLYTAHHPFGWSDLYNTAIFEEKPPFTVVNTLPPSEKRFSKVRESVRESVSNSCHEGMVCEGKRFDLVMMMCSQPHYMLITDDLGNALEPTIDDLLTTNCSEIIDFMDAKWKEENTPWLKENLRRAKRDFERLINTIDSDRNKGRENILFQELIEK